MEKQTFVTFLGLWKKLLSVNLHPKHIWQKHFKKTRTFEPSALQRTIIIIDSRKRLNIEINLKGMATIVTIPPTPLKKNPVEAEVSHRIAQWLYHSAPQLVG